jgi:hypothetical protein
MKIVKNVIVLAFVVFVLFFAFYKSDPISLEGTWDVQEISLNGEILPLDTLARYFNVTPQIVLNNWSHTMTIEHFKDGLHARFHLTKYGNNNYQVQLTSKDATLRGLYHLDIDTIDNGPQAYTVFIRLQSKKSYLHFKRDVVIPPWKPPFPRKGQV